MIILDKKITNEELKAIAANIYEGKMTLPSKPDESRWAEMPLMEQLANISSEVGRTFKWMTKGNTAFAESAFIRALDLIDLCIKYGRLGEPGRESLLKELCRFRDIYAEAVLDKDLEALKSLDKYCSHFARAYALHKS